MSEHSIRSLFDVRDPADLLRDMRLVLDMRVDWRKFGWRRLWCDGAERWRVIRWAEAFDIVKAAGLLGEPPGVVKSRAYARALRVGRAVVRHFEDGKKYGKRVLP